MLVIYIQNKTNPNVLTSTGEVQFFLSIEGKKIISVYYFVIPKVNYHLYIYTWG